MKYFAVGCAAIFALSFSSPASAQDESSDEKKLGARHGGKARPLRRQGTGN